MAFTDNRKAGIDWPSWQQSLAVETANTAISGTCAPDIGTISPVSDGDRYIYYFVSTGFYKFDTYENSWVRLSLPNIVAATGVSMRYAPFSGHRGRVLAATSLNVTLASQDGQLFNQQRIRIVGGTGKGQERMLIGPTGIIANQYAEGRSTTGSATAVTDTALRMRVNEHAGRQVALTYGAGNPDIRTVLYNDQTTLTVSDPLYQQICPFENQGWSAIAPHAIPVSVASGVGSHFVVEDNTFLVYDITGAAPQAWDVTPDSTSRYVILGGGIWLLSSLTTPFFSLQYYDVITDTWFTKTTPTGLMLAAATEWNLERCGEAAGSQATGTADAGSTTRILVDAAAQYPDTSPWTTDCWVNFEVRIASGTGIGQRRRIIANTPTSLTVDKKFATAPDATSGYEIYGLASKVWARFGGSAGLYQYDQDCDLWSANYISDYGIACRMAVWMTDHQPIYVASATRATTGITGVNATPTAGGSGYVRGDILTCSATGSNGQVFVNRVSSTGAVEEIILVRCGSGYSTGTGKATTGGSGTLCTIEITSVGTIGRITTTGINHYYKQGDVVNFGGATDATWNTSYTIVAVDSLTTFDVVTAAAGSASAAAGAQSTTLIVDASKNWDVNEHVGKYVSTQGSGLTGTLAIRRIDSNTETTLTLAAGDALAGALTNATGRYAILDTPSCGRESLYKQENRDSIGYATGGGATTLQDTSKTWFQNQWAGHKFRILSGTGVGYEVTITSNDHDTLTYSAPGFTPDTTSKYLIYDTFGKCTSAGSTTALNDSAKNWPTNFLVGKRVRIIAGTGFGNEMTILTNTATQLTFAAVTGLAPDTTTAYVVYGPPAMGIGGQMIWPYANSVASIRAHYIVGLRGASNAADAYDINKDRWDVSVLTTPINDVFGSGTMLAYDGSDAIYVHVNNTGRIYKFDLTSFRYQGAGQMPYAHGTLVAGNRMEIIKTADGALVLYIMPNSGAVFYRKVLRS